MLRTPELTGEVEPELVKSSESKAVLPKSSENMILAPGKDIEIIEDEGMFKGAVEERIRQWFETSDESSYFVGYGGLPGVGKTTLMESLRNICSRLNVNLFEIGVDQFIQTDRNSPMRELITKDPKIFERLYYCKESVKKALNTAHQMNGHGARVQFERMYDRKDGTVKPGQIVIPQGRKVILLEGVGSIPIIDELHQKQNASVLKVHVHDQPQEAMRRAINRDLASGSRKRADAERLRTAEYNHLVEPENKVNPKKADIIYMVQAA